LKDFQDIQAEEAKKDWKGEKAKNIQRLIDAVARDRLELENVEFELADYVEDDLLEEELDIVLGLHRRSRRTK
jgi:hypothetical protein